MRYRIFEERTNDLLNACNETNTSNFVERRYMCDLSFFYRDKKGIIDNNIISSLLCRFKLYWVVA